VFDSQYEILIRIMFIFPSFWREIGAVGRLCVSEGAPHFFLTDGPSGKNCTDRSYSRVLERRWRIAAGGRWAWDWEPRMDSNGFGAGAGETRDRMSTSSHLFRSSCPRSVACMPPSSLAGPSFLDMIYTIHRCDRKNGERLGVMSGVSYFARAQAPPA